MKFQIPKRVNSGQELESSDYSMMIIEKYTDPSIQIPYTDRKRLCLYADTKYHTKGSIA